MENMEKLEDVHICIQPQPQPQPHISETREKGEKGEKIQNGKLDLNMLDAVNYITLETMSNNDSYTKYLKRNKLDHDAVLKKEYCIHIRRLKKICLRLILFQKLLRY